MCQGVRREVVITLPYRFDTSERWQRLVKMLFAFQGFLMLALAGGIASGKFGGTIGIALALGILAWIARRVRNFPMGAAGILTSTDVETRQVKVLWYSLPMPVGKFLLDHFHSIAVVEHVYVSQSGGGARNTGSVRLVGKAGTPDIEVAFDAIDKAIEVARELANLLPLEYHRVDAPESHTVRVTFS
jgi:hypothetical protein